MRVVETDTTPTYKMGKNRKHRLRKKNEGGGSDSSDDGAGASASGCTHINKAVNLAAVRKALSKASVTFGECQSCSKDVTKGPSKEAPVVEGATADVGETEQETTIWVCLQCGSQGCDRNSKEKHALAHYETPHSGIHCIVVNLTTWAAWCYACDDDIPVENSKRIQECVDMLRKMAGLPRFDYSAGRRARPEPAVVEHAVAKEKTRPTTPKTTGATSVCQKVKGLNNLGNTCFFNAVMQNLSQTHSLEGILCDRTKKGRSVTLLGRTPHSDSDTGCSSDDDSDEDLSKELPTVEIVPTDAGPLTQALLSFLQEMDNTASTRNMVVNPSGVFGLVCKKAPRFKGFQQQDSHELLRYLLDVIRTEEIKRGQAGILKHFKLEGTNPKKVDDETKMKIKEYGRQVKHTFLDTLFGGQLVSTVMCEECKHVSQIFESFLDLSLPVTEEKPLRPNLVLGGRKKESVEAAEEMKGIDGFADRPDKPSKYAERKQKKQAKREAKAKRRGAKQAKQKGYVIPDERAGKDESAAAEAAKDEDNADVDEEEEKMSPRDKLRDEEAEESPGSNRDDQSDADIEDNLDSDLSQVPGTQDKRSAGAVSLEQTNRPCLVSQTSHDELNDSMEAVSGDLTPPPLLASGEEDILGDVVGQMDSLHLQNQECNGICGQGDERTEYVNQISNCVDYMQSAAQGLANGDGHGVNGVEMCDSVHKLDIAGQVDCCSSLVQSVSIGSTADTSDIIPSSRESNERCVNHCDTSTNGPTSVVPREPVMNGDVSLPEEEQIPQSCEKSESGDTSRHIDGIECDGITGCDSQATVNGTTECDSQATLKGESDETLCTSSRNVTECLSQPSNDDLVANGLTGRPSPNQAKNKLELRKQAQYKSMNTLAPRYHPSAKECSIMSCLHQFTSAELLTGPNKFGCKECTRMKRNKAIQQQKDKKCPETVYSNASKQYLIFLPPAILTLHLKRFEQIGFNSRKVNRHVDFPFLFDLAPYCSSLCQGLRPGQKKVIYSLYGVVEHSGRLSGGHYTAYVKVRPSLAATTSYLHPQVPTPREYISQYAQHMLNGPRSPEEELSDETLESLVPPGKWYHVSDSHVSEAQESTVQRAQAYLLFYERIY